MEEMLHSGLNPDEKVLWRGKPEAFETLDKTHKKKFTIALIIGLLITLGIAAMFIISAQRNGVSAKWGVIVIAAILCGIPTFNILGDASKLRKTEYAVTDQRLIILRDSFRGVEFQAIQEAEFRSDPDGHISLLCGADARKAKPDKWREICLIGQNTSEGTNLCTRFVFYAPTDLNGLKTILKDRLPLK